jgi:hypothetical protein
MGARAMNLSVGMWLFLSSFMWPHGRAQTSSFLLHGTRPATAVNHVLVGLVIASLASLRRIGHEPRPQSS